MAGTSYAFFGIAYLGSFFFIQLVMNRLLGDPTNIEFNKSMKLASATGLMFWFGLPVVGTLFSLGGIMNPLFDTISRPSTAALRLGSAGF